MADLDQHVSEVTSGGFARIPQQLDDTWRTFAKLNAFPSEEELLSGTGADSLGGINMAALAFACSQAISDNDVPTLALLSYGSYNVVFLLTFPDGKKVAARVPFISMRSPGMIESQVATMAFARFSLDIPTPTVYAWKDEPENPINAPYMIMEFISGMSLADVYHGLALKRKVRILSRVAKLHASLAHELHFTEFGSLVFSDFVKEGTLMDLANDEAYTVGPLMRQMDAMARKVQAHWPSGPVGGLRELWEEALTAEGAVMVKHWGQVRKDFRIHEQDDKVRRIAECEAVSWGEVELAQQAISRLVETCPLSTSSQPCLVHPDWAFRNILVDPTTLTIKAIIDWDGAAVLPLELLPQYPHDLCSSIFEGVDGARILRSEDIYASLPSTRQDLPRKSNAITDRLRRFERGELHKMPNFVSNEILNDVSNLATMVERTVARDSYLLLLSAWNENLPADLWQTSYKAKMVHCLITRGFTEWCRIREWLQNEVEKSQPGSEARVGLAGATETDNQL